MNTFTRTAPKTNLFTSLVVGNVLRVGLVLTGMTVFIAAAEAKPATDQLDLTNLSQVVEQIAYQDTMAPMAAIGTPSQSRVYRLGSTELAGQVQAENLLNSQFAKFLAEQLN